MKSLWVVSPFESCVARMLIGIINYALGQTGAIDPSALQRSCTSDDVSFVLVVFSIHCGLCDVFFASGL